MTWSPLSAACQSETPKTRWRAIPYTSGRGLDIGCGKDRLFESEYVIGVDNFDDAQRGLSVQASIKADARDLSQFSGGAWDFIYSSFLLQRFPYKDVPNVLREWMRLLKANCNLVLYLPDADTFPKCAEPELGVGAEGGADTLQQWNVTYERVVAAMEKVAFNWDLIYFEKCCADDEYGLFFVFRRLK
jgi:predicted SAM-dependent methyltransferase